MEKQLEVRSERQDLEVMWTPRQVANYFQVSMVTVYRWINQGKMFDPTKIVRLSNFVRIPRSEVERLAAINTKKILNAEQ